MPEECRRDEFDLFISYAHCDNEGKYEGRVTELVDSIIAVHDEYTTDRPRPFFDKHAIRDMDDWEQRIYKGLRQSKVMLVVLSPQYFSSVYCRKEWERYVELELQYALLGDEGMIAPIYVVTHPDFERNAVTYDAWINDLKRRQYVDVRPWWPEGPTAWRREAVRSRLEMFEQTLWKRICTVNAQTGSVKNLPDYNKRFVGRSDDLAWLHDMHSHRRLTAITALHGIGGIGKSALANAYAYHYAHEYPGGRFQIAMENLVGPDAAAMLRDHIVDLAVAYLGLELSDDQRRDARQAFLRAKAKFEASPLSLIILDNLNDPKLLAPAVRTESLPAADRVHILSTTRLDPEQLGDVACRAIDRLSLEEGLALLSKWRELPTATASDDERQAAREVVDLLGGHALAVNIAGAYLVRHPEKTYSTLAAYLKSQGLLPAMNVVGRDVAERNDVLHPEKLLVPLLQPTLATLSLPERRILELAALLPADNVPLPWIRRLLVRGDAELVRSNSAADLAPDPWVSALRRLHGLGLLVMHVEGDFRLSRCHRVVQAVVAAQAEASVREADEQALLAIAFQQTAEMLMHFGSAVVWEIPPLEGFVAARTQNESPAMAQISHGLADALHRLGKSPEARRYYLRALEIRERLARERPDDIDAQCDLCTSCNVLGNLTLQEGKPEEARRFFHRSLEIAQQKGLEPTADFRRVLSQSCLSLGGLSLAEGNLEEGRRYYRQALENNEQLARDLPDDFAAQIELSMAWMNMAFLSLNERKPREARYHFLLALKKARRSVRVWPNNVIAWRAVTGAYNGLGQLSGTVGQLDRARRYFTRSFEIHKRLARDLPDDFSPQRDVVNSCDLLGGLSLQLARTDEARNYYLRALEIRERLAHDLPEDVDARRDLSKSCEQLGKLELADGKTGAAEGYFLRALEICERLAQHRPNDVEAKWDIADACNNLGDLRLAEGKVVEARRYFSRALKICEPLARSLPNMIRARQSLVSAYIKLGNQDAWHGDQKKAKRHLRYCRDELLDMVAKGLPLHPAMAELLKNLQALFAGSRS